MFGIPVTSLKTWGIVALVVIVLYLLLRALLRKLNRKLPTSTLSWKSYLRGQGAVVFLFLLAGGLLAAVTARFGPWTGQISSGGQLTEYRGLNPSEHIIYEEENVEQSRHVTLLTRTVSPPNGSATIVIYGDTQSGDPEEINRIQSTADSWSRWDKDITNKHITFKVMNGGSGAGATQVDVLFYRFSR